MQNMDTNKQIHSLENEEKKKRAAFASELKNALQFFDPERPPNKITSTYSRESLRTYLRNPATDANNKNLRKLSIFIPYLMCIVEWLIIKRIKLIVKHGLRIQLLIWLKKMMKNLFSKSMRE